MARMERFKMNTVPNDKRKIRVKSALKKTTHLDLFKTIKGLIENARKAAQKSVNVTMVSTYFEIGRIILEHEQKGKKKEEMGSGKLFYRSTTSVLSQVIYLFFFIGPGRGPRHHENFT
ncbi:MAG: hypothetical protein PVH61_30115 [Candidatus Aminicenantes bacterium]